MSHRDGTGTPVTSVHLHLGAHKTATTYLQECLKASPDLFDRYQCRFATRDDIPAPLWRSIVAWQKDLSSTAPLPEYAEFLSTLRSGGEGHTSLLLSDEGLIGRVELSLDGSIYPSSTKSIAALRDAFDTCEVQVAFSVRNYADYILSTYSEIVNGGFSTRTFDNYLDLIDLPSLSWARVVDELRQAFGEAKVHVRAYESYRADPWGHSRELVESFLGPGSGDLVTDIGDTRVRTSTGSTALELQQRINLAVRKRVSRKARWRAILGPVNTAIRDAFAGVDDPPLQLPAALQAELDERYRRDCRRLGITLPGNF